MGDSVVTSVPQGERGGFGGMGLGGRVILTTTAGSERFCSGYFKDVECEYCTKISFQGENRLVTFLKCARGAKLAYFM